MRPSARAARVDGSLHLEWQAHEQRSAPFYERLGYRGMPCPQPDYPTFVIDFADLASETSRDRADRCDTNGAVLTRYARFPGGRRTEMR